MTSTEVIMTILGTARLTGLERGWLVWVFNHTFT